MPLAEHYDLVQALTQYEQVQKDLVTTEHTGWLPALQREHTFYPSITVGFFGRGKMGEREGRGKAVTKTTLEDRITTICWQELTESTEERVLHNDASADVEGVTSGGHPDNDAGRVAGTKR